MPSKSEHHSRLRSELHALQTDITKTWIDRSIPDGWNTLDDHGDIAPHKTKVTMRVDSDMLKWFRKLGTGYQARMNAVLRIYWHALLAGDVKSHWEGRAEFDQFLRATGLYQDASAKVERDAIERAKRERR